MATQSSGADLSQRIDLLHARDMAYWCQVFQIDMARLRHAVQQVGPQAQAVYEYLQRQGASPT